MYERLSKLYVKLTHGYIIQPANFVILYHIGTNFENYNFKYLRIKKILRHEMETTHFNRCN